MGYLHVDLLFDIKMPTGSNNETLKLLKQCMGFENSTNKHLFASHSESIGICSGL